MPTYNITDPDSGKSLKLTGDSPPTEQELNRIFSTVKSGKTSEPLKTPEEGKSLGGFVKNVGSDIAGIAKGAYHTLTTNPVDIAIGLGKTAVGASAALQKKAGLLDQDTQVEGEQQAREMAAPFVKAARNPSGLPSQIGDYIYGKPVSSMLLAAPVVGQISKATGLTGILKEGANITADMITAATKRPPAVINKQIDNIISKGVEQSIRPTVYGKATATQAKIYMDKAKDAVRTIVDNKHNLILTDAEGIPVTGALPKSLKQFSEAIDQTKKGVFKQYDALAKEAGGSGAVVDLGDVVQELNKIRMDPVMQDLGPEISKYAESRATAFSNRGAYSAEQAQDAVTHLNKTLEAFYKNPSYENSTKAGIDALIANNIRKSLDTAIESATGEQYQLLKKKYGSLKTVEKDVVHRSLVDARKNIKGLIDFSDIFSSGEFVAGILTMNPHRVAKGVIMKSVSSLYKRINDPNRIVNHMFRDVDHFSNHIESKIMDKFGHTIEKYPIESKIMDKFGHTIEKYPSKTLAATALAPEGQQPGQMPDTSQSWKEIGE